MGLEKGERKRETRWYEERGRRKRRGDGLRKGEEGKGEYIRWADERGREKVG